MSFVTTVRVVVRESQTPLGGVKVALFDRDQASADDRIGVQVTDARGEARFAYSALAFMDTQGTGDESPLLGFPPRRPDMTPDVFAVVYGAQDEVVASTRAQVKENVMLPAISIAIDQAVALEHGLIKRKPGTNMAEKQRQWARYWRERRLKEQGPGPDIDLCISRVVLDMVAGAANPKNELQKKLALRLRKQMTKKDIARVVEAASQGRDLVDQTLPSGRKRCSSDSKPEDLARLFFSPGGPLHGITQALRSMDPDPESTLPAAPVAGVPFTTDVQWIKTCQERFLGNVGPPLDERTRKLMQENPKELVPPSINTVLVWDPALRKNTREGYPADRSVRVWTLGGRESWVSKTLRMNVPLNDPACLVMQAASDGNQALVVDVRPGQKIDVYGSGFINPSASVEVFHRPWKTQPNNGRLEPENLPGAPADYAGRSVQGWNNTEVKVYGSDVPHAGWTPATYAEDRILFTWPDAASSEGLYRVRFTFRNDPEVTHTPTRVTQRSTDCDVQVDYSPVQTQELWFAVLPPVAFRPVRVQATSVTCLDETNPERFGPFDYFDDVVYSAAGAIHRVEVDTDALEGAQLTENLLDDATRPHVVASTGPKQSEHWFWSAPEVWGVPDPALFPGSAADNLPVLGRFDFMTLTLNAMEIEGPADRALLSLIVIAFIAALVILLLAVIAAAVIAAVVFYAAGWLSYGIAWLILVIIEAVLGAFGAFIVTLLGGAMSALLAIVAAIPPGDLIANASATFGGAEIAHRCSRFRFHRALWLHDRPAAVSSLPGVAHETLQFDENGIRESYTCSHREQGSRYKMEVSITFT